MAKIHGVPRVQSQKAICTMGIEWKYSEITWHFIFIPKVYYFKYFQAKAKMTLHTETKPRFILSNNFDNKLSKEHTGARKLH